MKNKKILSLGCVAVMIAALFTGCGSSGYKGYATNDAYAEYDYGGGYYDSAAPMATPMEGESAYNNSNLSITDDVMPMDNSRKLITTVDLSCETLSYDDAMQTVNDKIAALGGYVENMSSSNYSKSDIRRCQMVVRIPSAKLKDFLGVVEESMNVTSYNRSVEDVTIAYVDTESRIKALKTEQDRLNELLAKANTIEEMLKIEERMTAVRYQLESNESVKRTYDNKIDYSTVNMSVREVKVYTEPEPEGFWSRIGRGFKDAFEDVGESIGDTFIGLITGIPYIIGFIIMFVMVFFIPGVIVFLVLLKVGVVGSKEHKAKVRAKHQAKIAERKVMADAIAEENKKIREEAAAKAQAKIEAKKAAQAAKNK